MNLFIFPTNTCFGIATPIDDIDGYNTIYKIKSRDFFKPLAILIDSFDRLEKNTVLNTNQIKFLKDYKKPFTIITDISSSLIDKNIFNKDIYKLCAFRVAHDNTQLSLTQKYGPLFLTSANKSGEGELFSTKDVEKAFKNEIEKYNVEILSKSDYKITGDFSSSDIFEFIGDTNNIKYMRKS